MQRLKQTTIRALVTLITHAKRSRARFSPSAGVKHRRNLLRTVGTAGFACLLSLLLEPQMQAAWVPMTMGSAWPNTADFNWNNSQGYPCRVHMNGGVQPGAAYQHLGPYWGVPAGVCVVGYGGKEVDSSTFDLWVDDWQPASNGNVPANAIPLGYESQWPGAPMDPRYACMALSPWGRYTGGKVAPDVGFCDFPWAGAEQHASNYYVLVDSALGLVESTGGPKLSVNALNAGLTGYTGNYVLEGLTEKDYEGNWLSPFGSVQVGVNDDGNNLVFCAGYYADGYHPGKGLQTINEYGYRLFQACNVSYGGLEHPGVSSFIGLALNWKDGFAGGYVPIDEPIAYNPSQFPGGLFESAIIAGQEADGSHLYMCAAYTEGVVPQLGVPGMWNMVGKTRPGLGGCSFGYSGQEMIYPNYSVLVETYTKPVS